MMSRCVTSQDRGVGDVSSSAVPYFRRTVRRKMLRLAASRSLRNGLSRTVTLQARRSLVTKFSKVRSTFHIVAAAALFFAGNIQASL